MKNLTVMLSATAFGVALMAGTALTTPAFAQKGLVASPSTDWAVSQFEGQGNNPGYCALARRFNQNMILTLAKNQSREISIALDFQRPKLNVSRYIDVVLDPGAGEQRSFNLQPISNKAFVVRLGHDPAFFDALNKTGYLRTEVDGYTYGFNLSDMERGHQKVDSCLTAMGGMRDAESTYVASADSVLDHIEPSSGDVFSQGRLQPYDRVAPEPIAPAVPVAQNVESYSANNAAHARAIQTASQVVSDGKIEGLEREIASLQRSRDDLMSRNRDLEQQIRAQELEYASHIADVEQKLALKSQEVTLAENRLSGQEDTLVEQIRKQELEHAAFADGMERELNEKRQEVQALQAKMTEVERDLSSKLQAQELAYKTQLEELERNFASKDQAHKTEMALLEQALASNEMSREALQQDLLAQKEALRVTLEEKNERVLASLKDLESVRQRLKSAEAKNQDILAQMSQKESALLAQLNQEKLAHLAALETIKSQLTLSDQENEELVRQLAAQESNLKQKTAQALEDVQKTHEMVAGVETEKQDLLDRLIKTQSDFDEVSEELKHSVEATETLRVELADARREHKLALDKVQTELSVKEEENQTLKLALDTQKTAYKNLELALANEQSKALKNYETVQNDLQEQFTALSEKYKTVSADLEEALGHNQRLKTELASAQAKYAEDVKALQVALVDMQADHKRQAQSMEAVYKERINEILAGQTPVQEAAVRMPLPVKTQSVHMKNSDKSVASTPVLERENAPLPRVKPSSLLVPVSMNAVQPAAGQNNIEIEDEPEPVESETLLHVEAETVSEQEVVAGSDVETESEAAIAGPSVIQYDKPDGLSEAQRQEQAMVKSMEEALEERVVASPAIPAVADVSEEPAIAVIETSEPVVEAPSVAAIQESTPASEPVMPVAKAPPPPSLPKFESVDIASPVPSEKDLSVYSPGYRIAKILEEASVTSANKINLVEGASSPNRRVYQWMTNDVYGSSEQIPLKDMDDFERRVQDYLEKTEERCQADFAILPDNTIEENGQRIDSYEVACVGDNVDSSASLVFFNRDGTFNVVAHEAQSDLMSKTMDLRDRVLKMLKKS